MKRKTITKSRLTLSLALVLTLFPYIVVHAQNQEYIINNLQVVKDFPSSTTFSIFKDSKGFMWFGTVNGLYRYDGYTFKTFQQDPNDSSSIESSYVSHRLFEDNDGMLWVSSASGLDRFNRVNETFKRYQIKTNYSFSVDHIIRRFCQDSQGNIWFITDPDGAFRYDPGKEDFTFYLVDNEDVDSQANVIIFIFEDSSGILWAGTANGLFQFDNNSDKFEQFKPKSPDSNLNLDRGFKFILEDNQGILWLATYNRLFKIDADKTTVNEYVLLEGKQGAISNYIDNIFEDPNDINNSLLVFTRNILYRFNKKNGEFTPYNRNNQASFNFSQVGLSSRYLDECGRIWHAMEDIGMGYFDLKNNIFEYYLSANISIILILTIHQQLLILQEYHSLYPAIHFS